VRFDRSTSNRPAEARRPTGHASQPEVAAGAEAPGELALENRGVIDAKELAAVRLCQARGAEVFD
jgi:hypothetical protein